MGNGQNTPDANSRIKIGDQARCASRSAAQRASSGSCIGLILEMFQNKGNRQTGVTFKRCIRGVRTSDVMIVAKFRCASMFLNVNA